MGDRLLQIKPVRPFATEAEHIVPNDAVSTRILIAIQVLPISPERELSWNMCATFAMEVEHIDPNDAVSTEISITIQLLPKIPGCELSWNVCAIMLI